MSPNMTYPFLMSLVQDVKRAFPGASVVCAGGAPRDLYHGRPVKDIDIFIQMQTIVGWRKAREDELKGQAEALKSLMHADNLPSADWAISQHLRELREIWKDDSEIYQEYFDGCEALSSLWHSPWNATGDAMDISNEKGYSYGAFTLVDFPCGPRAFPIQLVFIDMDPVENVRDHFDFGLSQIWVAENKVRTLPQFWQDHYRQVITYLPSKEPVLQRRWSSRNRVERLKEKYPDWRFHGLANLTFSQEELAKIEAWESRVKPAKRETNYVTRACLGEGD